MRTRWIGRAAYAALGALLGTSAVGGAQADEVRLKSGTTIRATVADRDAQHVLLRVPRDEIAAVNGKPLPEPPAQGHEAPAFQVTDLSGGRQAIPDPAGRATLLQFWASWCPYCRSDMALLKDLHARYQEQGLRILAVSTDQEVEKLKTFVQEHQLPYPIVANAQQAAQGEEALPARYEVNGIPAYYVIDPNGRISALMSGAAAGRKAELERALTAALQVARKAGRSSSSSDRRAPR